jgi:hypothetical protein
MGVPVPDGWLCVPTSLVPEVLPDDFDAAMIRLAVECGRKGFFFRPDVRINDPKPVTKEISVEVHAVSGALKYVGSMWLRKTASENPSLALHGEFRPLLVSGYLDWGTKAVFDGYVSAMADLGINTGCFEYDAKRKLFSQDVALKLLLAECADKRNGYTHLLVTDGLSIPQWVLESCGLQTVLISTEDPYSLDITSTLHPMYDYSMSNDRAVAEAFGVSYLPTAADISRCRRAVSSPLRNGREFDVSFIGALYPDRKKMLVGLHDMCKKEGLRLFAGGTCKKEDAAELPFFVQGEFTTDQTLLVQASSKVCVNMFRSAYGEESKYNTSFKLDGSSMSPRCYDAPACGAALVTDYRQEVEEIYGRSCICEPSDFPEFVRSMIKTENWQETAVSQSKEVEKAQTYLHRALVIMALVEKGIVYC